MSDQHSHKSEAIEGAIIEMAIASWKFSRVFYRLIEKLNASDQSKYINQYRFYIKFLQKSLEIIDLRIVDIEGQLYDPGIAATAVNLDEFNTDDKLIVDNMLEPIIMGPEGVIKSGAVILRRQ